MDSYHEWRGASSAVQAAYEGWVASGPADRDAAFGGYLAALQREFHAARVYQSRLERLEKTA